MVDYDVILLDPPWSYTGSKVKWGAAAKFYDCLNDEQIIANDPTPFLSRRGIVFLWATCPQLDKAMFVLREWHLAFRGIPFVWVKTKKSDPEVPVRAQGVRPSIVKPTTELVLAASRVGQGRPMPLADESVCQVVLAPKRQHSRKPDEVQERIEALYPEARRLEMYARFRRDGWDAWGDEIDGNMDMRGVRHQASSGVQAARGSREDGVPLLPPTEIS